MAMQFNLPPAGVITNADNALDNLRLGYMVDRFTGQPIDRTIAGQANDITAVTGGTNSVNTTLGTTRSITAAGSYHISDRIIYMTAGQLIAASDGVHISFYNCTFCVDEYISTDADLVFAFGITNDALDTGPDARGASARVSEGATNTRSINFYGCTVSVSSTGQRGNIRFQLADSIGSDFRVGGDGPANADLRLTPSPQRGGRWINTSFVASQQRNFAASMQTYGFPDVYENVELYGFGFDNGVEAESSGPRMLVEPNYTLLGQQNIYTIQGNNRAGFSNLAQILQNVGFFTPPDNANNDDGDVLTWRGTPAGYVDLQNGGGGTINYAAYQPTYRDAISGAGIQNVRVRVNSSIGLNNNNATVASTFHTKLLRLGDTQTIGTSFIGSEYLTNTNGQLASSRYTRDGWSTSSAGYFDPMIFDSRTAVGSNQLADNTLLTPNLTPPANTALAVIQDVRGASSTDLTFTRHEAQYQAFSWSHDIRQELSETSTTLIDGSTRATGTLYGINSDISITAPSLIGTFVKASVTASDNTPILSDLQNLFAQDATPSINDVRMAIRYERYQYAILGNPQTTVTNLTVDNTHGSAWTVTEVTGGYNTIVRGAGLAADTATDLYTGDPNLGTVNMNGNPITGLTLGQGGSLSTSETVFTGLRAGDNQTLYAAQGGALTGSYTSTSGGDIFFDGVNVSQLRIIVDSGTLNIRGTDQDGAALTSTSFRSVGGSGNTMFPAPVVSLTVNTPDEPGYFGVLNVTQNTVVTTLENAAVGFNSVITGSGVRGTFEIPSDNRTDTFRFYWKAANTSTTGYSTTVIERSNAGLTMSMEETMSATPLIATLYGGDAELGKANTDSPDPLSTSGINSGMRILVDNDTTTNGNQSQYHILSAMDWPRYIDVLTANNLATDIIAPDTVSSTVSDAQYIQLDTQTMGEQQQLVGAQFSNVNGRDNMLYVREDFDRETFAFVTRTDQLTTRNRFFIRDTTTGDLLQDSSVWPGLPGSFQITDSELVVVAPTTSNLITVIQGLEAREFDLSTVRGQIFPRDTSGTQAANFNFIGINYSAATNTIVFSLTVLNRGGTTNTNILNTIGFSSGTETTMLSGNTLTGVQTDQVVQITGTGFSFPSVTLFPNPAGATPAQIQQAATAAINSSTAIATTRNGVGYMIGQGGDSRLIGIKPRATNYNSTDDYTGNL